MDDAKNVTELEECPDDDVDCLYVPFTPSAKMGIGMGIGFAVFLVIFLTVGFIEQYLKDKAEEEYQQMMAEQRLREKLLKTARHVDQITAMVARAHTGLNIIDITQLELSPETEIEDCLIARDRKRMAQLKLDHTLGTLEKNKEKLSQLKLDQAAGALEATTTERPNQLGLTSATELEDSLTVRDRKKTAQLRPVHAAEMQTRRPAQQKEEATQCKLSPVTDLENTKDNKRKCVQTEDDLMLTSASLAIQKKFSNLNHLSSVEASDNETENDENSQLGLVVSYTSKLLGFGSPKSQNYTTGSPKHRDNIPDSPRSKDMFTDVELPHTAAFKAERNDPKDDCALLDFSDTAGKLNKCETEKSEKLQKHVQVSPKDCKIKIKGTGVDVERVHLLDPIITLPELGFNTSQSVSPFSLDSSTSQKQVSDKFKPTGSPGSKKGSSPNKQTATAKRDLDESVSEDLILTRKRNSLDASNTPRKHAKAFCQDVIQKLSPKKQSTNEKYNLDQSTRQDLISTTKHDLVQMSSDPSFSPKSRHISFPVTRRKRSPRKTVCRNYVM